LILLLIKKWEQSERTLVRTQLLSDLVLLLNFCTPAVYRVGIVWAVIKGANRHNSVILKYKKYAQIESNPLETDYQHIVCLNPQITSKTGNQRISNDM